MHDLDDVYPSPFKHIDPGWTTLTLTLIFTPMIYSAVNTMFTLASVTFGNFVNSGKNRKTIITTSLSHFLLTIPLFKGILIFNRINRKLPETDGLYEVKALEVCLESIPQLVLQLVISLRLGYMSYAQILGLGLSFTSMSVFAYQELTSGLELNVLDHCFLFPLNTLLTLPTFFTLTIEVTELRDHAHAFILRKAALIIGSLLFTIAFLHQWKTKKLKGPSNLIKVILLPLTSGSALMSVTPVLCHIMIIIVFYMDLNPVVWALPICSGRVNTLSVLHCFKKEDVEAIYNVQWNETLSYMTCSFAIKTGIAFCHPGSFEDCRSGFMTICDSIFGRDDFCTPRIGICHQDSGRENVFNHVAMTLAFSQIVAYFLSRLIHFRLGQMRVRQAAKIKDVELCKIETLC